MSHPSTDIHKHLSVLTNELRLLGSIADEYEFDYVQDRIGSGAFSVVYRAKMRRKAEVGGDPTLAEERKSTSISSAVDPSPAPSSPCHPGSLSSSVPPADDDEDETAQCHHRRRVAPPSPVVVALKIIPKRRLETEKHAKDVLREARLLSLVESSHCPRLIEAVQTRNDVILVMTLVEGVELGKVIRKTGAFPEAVAKKLIREILNTIYFLHSKDCVHRDIKPDNLLLAIPNPSSAGSEEKPIDGVCEVVLGAGNTSSSSSSSNEDLVDRCSSSGGDFSSKKKDSDGSSCCSPTTSISNAATNNNVSSNHNYNTQGSNGSSRSSSSFNLFTAPGAEQQSTAHQHLNSPLRGVSSPHHHHATSSSGGHHSVVLEADDLTLAFLTESVLKDSHHIALVDFGFARGVSLCESKIGGLINSCEDLSALVGGGAPAEKVSQEVPSNQQQEQHHQRGGGIPPPLVVSAVTAATPSPLTRSPNTCGESGKSFEEQTLKVLQHQKRSSSGKKVCDSEVVVDDDDSHQQDRDPQPLLVGAGEVGATELLSNNSPVPDNYGGCCNSSEGGHSGGGLVKFQDTVFLSTCGAERFLAPELLKVILEDTSSSCGHTSSGLAGKGSTGAVTRGCGTPLLMMAGRRGRGLPNTTLRGAPNHQQPQHSHDKELAGGGNGNGKKKTTTELAKKVDMYSLGVLCFVLLTGCFPFNGKTKSSLLTQTLNGAKFNSPSWSGVSKEAQIFVANLMSPDPEHRLSAATALDHLWFKQQQ